MDISYQADFLHWCVGRRHRVWSDRRPVSKHQLWSSRIDFYVSPPYFCSLSPCSIGRRKTLMAAVLLWNVSGFALCWAPEYISFIILEFIVAAAQHGAFMVCNVMGKPLLRPCVRLVLSVCLSVCRVLFVCSSLITFTLSARVLVIPFTLLARYNKTTKTNYLYLPV